MVLLKLLLNRLREPSSMAGIAGLLAAIGISLPENMVTEITVVVGGLAAIASMIMAEKGPSE